MKITSGGSYWFGGLERVGLPFRIDPIYIHSLTCSLPIALGLLAGLHEFPTLPNVSRSKDPEEVPRTILSNLLSTPLPSHPVDQRKASMPPDSVDDSDSLRITKSLPAGDVVHVFSHIKKTYRVQWVVLEGGGVHPPELRMESTKTSHKAKPDAKFSSRIKDGRVIDANHEARDSPSTPVPSALRWVALHGVTEAKYVHSSDYERVRTMLYLPQHRKRRLEDLEPSQNALDGVTAMFLMNSVN